MTVGRIVIPAPLPAGFALFYTTADSDGAITPELTDILRERFGIEATLATCNQVHSAIVQRVAADISRPDGSRCDALFTSQRGVALGIKIADCLPVSLCDPVHRVIANIHSGWRGAVQGITAETLDALARETDFDPRRSYAYLGPSIRVCCFEVGEDVAAQFDPAWVDRTRGAKPHVDIAAMTAAILRARGVEHVIDVGVCTKCSDGAVRFHSYRRDKRSGRNLAIAAQ